MINILTRTFVQQFENIQVLKTGNISFLWVEMVIHRTAIFKVLILRTRNSHKSNVSIKEVHLVAVKSAD